jgi:hypothetical protein
VLSSLRQLVGEPQLVADLFVNYDCDPHAPPLYERTVQVSGCVSVSVTHTRSPCTSAPCRCVCVCPCLSPVAAVPAGTCRVCWQALM